MSLLLAEVEETSGKICDLPDHVLNPDPSIYESDNYVVLDFETTNKQKGTPLDPDNYIVCAVWGSSGEALHYRRASEYELGDLVEAVMAADFVVAHNSKFELGWLKRCSADLRSVVVYDTMTAEYVLGGNRYYLNDLSLAACLRRRKLAGKGDIVSLMIKMGYPVQDIPEKWLREYCIKDVEATHKLFLKQQEQFKKNKKLAAVNYMRNLLTPCLADIEFNGMQLDEEAVLKLEKEQEAEYVRLTNRLQEFCGGASPSSPKQMREFIYGELGFQVPTDHNRNPILTNSGDPSTAAPVLERLVARTARQREFLDRRASWSKAHSDLTKYVRKFADCVRDSGGFLRASFNQCNTRTHRLSSSGLKHKVQFQNFNRGFKKLFRPRVHGWIMGEADGSQLEFRVAAHLGRDPVALSDIAAGVDVHQRTADVIGCSRQEAKSRTFKPLYAGTSGTDDERRYYDSFKERYSRIFDTQTAWTQTVLATKELETEWGLKYYWPDTKMTRSGYITNSTSIFNYPVQALATAEIIPISLVCMWHRMRELESFIVNTVHDSIITEIHPNECSTWMEIVDQTFLSDTYSIIKKLYGMSLTIPLAAEVTGGEYWGDSAVLQQVYSADDSLWKDAAKREGMIR